MKNIFKIMIALSCLFFSCEDGFEDFDSRTLPPPLEITITIPQYLEFTFIHSVIPDSTLIENTIQTNLEVLNVSGSELTEIEYVVNIYSDSVFDIDNLIFSKRSSLDALNVAEKNMLENLSKDLPEELKEDQIEIQITNINGVFCSSLADIYEGNYNIRGISMGDSLITGIGSVNGFINCQGNIELKESAGSPINLLEGFISPELQITGEVTIGNTKYDFDKITQNSIEQNNDTLRLSLFAEEPLQVLDSLFEINLTLISN